MAPFAAGARGTAVLEEVRDLLSCLQLKPLALDFRGQNIKKSRCARRIGASSVRKSSCAAGAAVRTVRTRRPGPAIPGKITHGTRLEKPGQLRQPACRSASEPGCVRVVDEQFAVDPRCSPKRVRDTHLANELANVGRGRWPAAARSRFPVPIGSEAGAVPAHQRLRPYNLQSVQHPGSQPTEPNKHQPVDAAEGHSFRGFAPQDVELVPKNEDFRFQRSPRPEQPDQGAPDQSAKITHRSDYQSIRGRQSAVLGLR